MHYKGYLRNFSDFLRISGSTSYRFFGLGHLGSSRHLGLVPPCRLAYSMDRKDSFSNLLIYLDFIANIGIYSNFLVSYRSDSLRTFRVLRAPRRLLV